MGKEDYLFKSIKQTNEREAIVCTKCKTEIINIGGSSLGEMFYECKCSKWVNKKKYPYSCFGYYDVEKYGIKRFID